jgi:flavin-dependent dehydrogenase
MKPITIIGGGLAGLTLGIMLRREGVPVAVVEAGHYPRHRVCGEFLSGRGREVLQDLGIEAKLPKIIEASRCSFHLRDRKPIRFTLKTPALCISRYDLDGFLAEEFQRAGGILKSGERAYVEEAGEGIVRATGRRRSGDTNAHLFGLKAHALKANSSSDLEMHFGDRQYVGVCKLAEQRWNVCGLFFSRHPVSKIRHTWKDLFRNSIWSKVLEDADWDENSFSSVAGITLDHETPENCFSVGDAAAMIPPLTGNGMSMAVESAELASPFLLRYSQGLAPWSECVLEHAVAWRALFWRRLCWAAVVQRLLFNSAGQRFLYAGATVWPSLPRLFFNRTR